MVRRTKLLALAAACAVFAANAMAEPWIAVQTGSKCVACHTSPTGGGKRNVAGAAMARGRDGVYFAVVYR
ncbi:MAG: hypothetical protein AAFU65_07320 [Pseudomonadota bacterium]